VSRIFIPAASAEDWRKFLAEPDIQWKPGYSARALAYCWQGADGFPDEIADLFVRSPFEQFEEMQLLLAFPEYVVPLPGKGKGSHNDLFVLAKDSEAQLVCITIEGRVSEPFGPTLAEWGAKRSRGKRERLAYLQSVLGFTDALPDSIRYQLLHRTASAVILARRFNARNAVMIVHSFSQADEWLEDYQQFTALFGVEAGAGALVKLNEIEGVGLYAGWVTGDESYLRI
jgi:hypothetical protein